MKVQINNAAIHAKVMTAWQKGLFALTTEVLADCNEYVKRESGKLEESSLIHSTPSEGKIVYETPYARRQYWEIQTAHTTVHPNATWKWFEAAKRRYLRKWKEKAQKGVNDNL